MSRTAGCSEDTWIYVQEPDVILGRLQIFNNWSPYLVQDPTKVWIGLEYFCYDTDDLWKMPDEELKKFAIAEVAKIGILNAEDVSDGHVVRAAEDVIRRTSELTIVSMSFGSLQMGLRTCFWWGRNGMHKCNNQDHSMLTAMTVVDGLVAGHVDKASPMEHQHRAGISLREEVEREENIDWRTTDSDRYCAGGVSPAICFCAIRLRRWSGTD